MFREIIFKLFKIEEKRCESCETLRYQLESVNAEKQRLLDTLLATLNPTKPTEEKTVEVKPIPPRHVPWHVRREMLQEQDRVKAKELKTLEELEKETGVAKDAS